MRDILKFMNGFVDGYGYAGVISAAEVPKIELATREFTAAGMAGPVDVRLGRLANALTAKLTFEGFDPHLYRTLALTEGGQIPLTIKGSAEDGDGVTHAHDIKMRGFLKLIDEGEWKDGEPVPLKLDLGLRYYKRSRGRRGPDRGRSRQHGPARRRQGPAGAAPRQYRPLKEATMAKPVTHTLKEPVTLDGETVTQLTRLAPKGRDIKRAMNLAGKPGDLAAEMIVNLAEVTPRLVDELDAADFVALSDIVGNFMGAPGAGAPKTTAP